MIAETRQTILIHERGDKCSECGGMGVSSGFDCEQCDGEGYCLDANFCPLSQQEGVSTPSPSPGISAE